MGEGKGGRAGEGGCVGHEATAAPETSPDLAGGDSRQQFPGQGWRAGRGGHWSLAASPSPLSARSSWLLASL